MVLNRIKLDNIGLSGIKLAKSILKSGYRRMWTYQYQYTKSKTGDR